MKIHSYRLLSAAALFYLMAAGPPCLAANSSTVSTAASPTASSTASTYDYGSATTGIGFDPMRGNQGPAFGNGNAPFSQWQPYTQNPNAKGNPYDDIPIDQLNNTNQDGSGQQIFDYQAGNGPGNMPTPGEIGTYKQIPIGRHAIAPSQEPGQQTGLMPATTAIQAGVVPSATLPNSPGQYSFSQIPSAKFSYGFDKGANIVRYSGPNDPAVTGIPYGGILPPTSMSSVDLNIYSGPLVDKASRGDKSDIPTYLTVPVP